MRGSIRAAICVNGSWSREDAGSESFGRSSWPFRARVRTRRPGAGCPLAQEKSRAGNPSSRRARDVIEDVRSRGGESTADSARAPNDPGSGPYAAPRATISSSSGPEGTSRRMEHSAPPVHQTGSTRTRARKEGSGETKAGADGHQGQESSRPSSTPIGAAGAAGCPEHRTPEQGRGTGGTGSFSDRPARSRIKGSMTARSAARDRSGRDEVGATGLARGAPAGPTPGTRRRLLPQEKPVA